MDIVSGDLSNKIDALSYTVNEMKKHIDSINRSVIKIEQEYELKTDVMIETYPDYTKRIEANERKLAKHDFEISILKSTIKDEVEERKKKTV